MKKNILAIVVLGAAVWAGGSSAWSNGTAPPPSGAETKAKETLEDLRQAYIDRDLNKFFKSVGEKSFFSDLDLQTRLSQRFRDFSQIELILSVDHALSENDKILLKTRWQRRMVKSGNGNVETAEGTVELIFWAGKDRFKLVDIKGDSPF